MAKAAHVPARQWVHEGTEPVEVPGCDDREVFDRGRVWPGQVIRSDECPGPDFRDVTPE